MAKKRSLYDTYSDKGLNGPIWAVGMLWTVLSLVYAISAGPIWLVCAGAGVVALVLMYNVRSGAIRFGGVATMAIVTAVIALTG